jgi:anti-sigma regulatory factor (Ser/Thr protein kinase)
MSANGHEAARRYAEPPYLFTAPRAGAGALVTVSADLDTAMVEIGVHGRWSSRLGGDVSAAIGKCLAEPPAGIIADLRDLGDPGAASAPLWLGAFRTTSVPRPPVQFALCLPTATALNRRLRRAAEARRLPLFATMAEARTAVARRLSPAPRLRAEMPPHPSCAGMARNLVAQAGDSWNLPEMLLMRATLVVSELVANAVEHAGTDIRVIVSQRGAGLHLAVRDGVSDLPLPGHPRAEAGAELLTRRGAGLGIVNAGADAWGAMPTRGGKIVWAAIRPRPDD